MTWKFEHPRNLGVITVQRILDRETSVVYVSHDDDDGSWQFFDGNPVTEEDARVVGLGRIIDLDPTLMDLADLPEGFVAMRNSRQDGWLRKPKS